MATQQRSLPAAQETNMIQIKTLPSFRKQMHIAETSNSLVVILFHQADSKDCKILLPHLEDLINHYNRNHEDKQIDFLRTDLKYMIDGYKVQSYPTVVVLKGDGKEVGRISIAETIIDRFFIKGLRMLLDDCLKETNMIQIKTLPSFRRQMNIAESSNSLVVILFQHADSKDCKILLPKLEDLINQYRRNHEDKLIKFLGTELKYMIDGYKVQSYPTVVVLKGDGKEVGRISIAETIIDRFFIKGLGMLLDDCLRAEDAAAAAC